MSASTTTSTRQWFHARRGVWATVIAGTLLSVAAFLFIDAHEKDHVRHAFSLEAGRRAALFREVLFDQMHDVASLALLVSVTPALQGDFFRSAARFHRERRNAPGAYLWVERVPGAQRGDFESRMRAAGDPEYRLRERGAGGALVEAASREEYFPSVFMEPRPVERAAQGFDLGSNAERRRVMDVARDRGDAAMTGRVTLATEPGRPDGLQVFFPVYHGAGLPETVEERRRRLRGFVVVVMRLADLVASAGAANLPPGWGVDLTASGVSAERERLFSTAGMRNPVSEGLSHAEPIQVAGQTLNIAFRAPAAGVPGSAAGALGAGMAITLVLAYVVALGHRRRALKAALLEAESRLRIAFDASPDAITLLGLSRRYEFANQVFCRLAGRPLEDIVGRTDRELFGEAEAARYEPVVERCIRDGQDGRFEVENRSGPASIWLEVQKVALKDAEGRVTGVMGIGRDITARKREELDKDRAAQDALREANERYRLATSTAGIWIFSVDLATDRMEADLAGIERLGYERAGFPATSIEWRDRIVPREYHAALDAEIRRTLHGESARVEVTVPARRRDGLLLWLRIHAGTERGADGRVLRLLGTAQDVTERVLLRRALEENEERWHFALEGAGDGVWDWDAVTGQVYFSHQWKAMLGYDDAEIGHTLEEWRSRVHPDDLAPVEALLEQHLSGKSEVYISEHRLRCKDGRYKWILDRGKVVDRDADGKPRRVIGTHADIDARKATERALGRLAERQRAVLDNLLAGIIVIDERGIIEEFSRQAGVIFGYAEAEVVGRNVSMLVPSPQREAHDGYLRRYLETGARTIIGSTRELEGVRKDGSRVPIELGVTETLHDGVRRYTGMVRDLTPRRAAQAALADSEARFRMLFENSPEAIVLHNAGVIEMLNPAALRLYGAADNADVIGRSVLDFIDPAQRAIAGERVRRLAAAPGAVPLKEYAQTRLDGSKVEVEAASASFAHRGEVRTVSMYRDITERKAVGQALRRSQARLRAVIDLVPVFLFAKDRDGRYLLANAAYARFFGLTPESIVGRCAADLGMTPAESAHTLEMDAQVRRSGVPKHVPDQRVTGPDGTTRIYSTIRIPFRFSDEHPDAVLAVSTDITDLKEAESRLRETVAFLEATMESTGDGIMVADAAGRVVRWNRRLVEAFGLDVALLREGDRERTFQSLRALFADFEAVAAMRERTSDPGYRGSEVTELRDGRHIERFSQPIEIDGRQAGRVWSFRDVTAREREKVDAAQRQADLEQRVATRTTELEEAMRDLNLFTSSVSHDLRAPLRAVDGFVTMALQDGGTALAPEVRRHLERLSGVVKSMSTMVEALLSMARHARAPIHRVRNDVAAMAAEVFEELQRGAQQSAQWRATAVPAADADPALLRVVLQNLIGNALKYSRGRDPAVIEFGATEQDGRTTWFVRDNGAGFDPQYAAKLFQPFGRLHSPREFEGTGIGLATVHRILERHGGRIWAESRPGEGATFHFTLS